MPTFTTELANRTTRELPLTWPKPARWPRPGSSLPNSPPEYGRYRLSKPYELVIIRDTNTLTIRQ